jgi:hypothetical protein
MQKIKLTWLFSLIFIILSIIGYFNFPHWIFYPPQPTSLCQPLFQGIVYIREVRQQPRPIIIHAILVDLTTPSINFLVTPGKITKQGEIGARTTSQFLHEFNLQLAINGSFFYPCSEFYWTRYPRYSGDPVYVVGLASAYGQIYSAKQTAFQTLYISADNQLSFTPPENAIYHAISGQELIIKQGQLQTPFREKFHDQPYPRTALALDKAKQTLIIVVVDGKQKNYSEGVTLLELAQIIQTYGGDTALNLDGGGSSTLVMAREGGKPQLLNSPIHAKIQGRERLIANHLGIQAKPVDWLSFQNQTFVSH